MNKSLNQLVVGCWAAALTLPSFAAASPWLPIPQTGTVTITHVAHEATQGWLGGNRVNLPFGTLEQNTTWLDLSYAHSDSLAFDLQIGKSKIDAGPLGSESANADTKVSARYVLSDEAINTSGFPTVTLRGSAILAGNYAIGRPHAMGDGASGVEASVLIGKWLTPSFGVMAEIGGRIRNNEVPNEGILNIGGFVRASERVGLYSYWERQISAGDINIGSQNGPRGPVPASHYLFQQVAEEVSRIRAGVAVSLIDELNVDVSYFHYLDGQNTSDFNILAVGVTLAFDTFAE